MVNRFILSICLSLVFGITSGWSATIDDDVVVNGSLCVGQDCNSNATYSDSVTLRENNVRMRLTDDSSTYSWELEANDSANGGESYFSVNSSELAEVSDGTATGYDSSGTYFSGYIPAGEEVYEYVGFTYTQVLDDDGNPVISDGTATGYYLDSYYREANGGLAAGETIYDFEGSASLADSSILKFAAGASGGVAIGTDAVTADGTVSIGSDGSEHRLTNVADGVEDNDAVTLGQLLNYNPYSDITELSAEIDALSDQIDDTDERLKYIMASAAALSALSPNGRSPGANQLSVGAGTYDGVVAVAVGYYRVVTPSVTANAALASTDAAGSFITRFGISYQF